jgi:hypothetical protein
VALGGSAEGGVAPLVHEMLQHVFAEMGRYARVIAHWPIFGPYLEAAMCIVLRTIIAAVSRQCGMVQVRCSPGCCCRTGCRSPPPQLSIHFEDL